MLRSTAGALRRHQLRARFPPAPSASNPGSSPYHLRIHPERPPASPSLCPFLISPSSRRIVSDESGQTESAQTTVRACRHSGHLPGEALRLTSAFVLSAQPRELLGIQPHAERETHRPEHRLDLVERFLAEVLRLEQLGLGLRHEVGDGPDVRGVPSTYLFERLTPLSGGIRDGAHLCLASPPPCPGSAAARSGARARPWPTISGSGSCCSSARTPTAAASDAVRRSPPHGQGIPVGLIQLRARHTRFARVSVAQ